MPRIKPTTIFTTTSSPISSWDMRIGLDYLIQEALGKILTELGEGILLERSIDTKWN